MPNITVANALFEVCMMAWERNGWRVHRHLQPNRRDKQLLATPDEAMRVVKLYPHPTDILPEKTGLHEILHITLGLSGDKRDEELTYWLEEWLWARLGKKQKAQLHAIFVAPLKDSE